MYYEVIRRLFQVPGEHLVIGIRCKFNDVANSDIDDTEKALVLLLEFLLIKHLDGEDAVFVHRELKALVPVWVERLLRNKSCLGLFAIDRRDSKWIGVSKNISFVKTVGSDDCDAEVWFSWWPRFGAAARGHGGGVPRGVRSGRGGQSRVSFHHTGEDHTRAGSCDVDPGSWVDACDGRGRAGYDEGRTKANGRRLEVGR